MNETSTHDGQKRQRRAVAREERMRQLMNYLPQRRIGVFDHLRPQRWNWYLVRRPMERTIDQQAPQPLTIRQVNNLRHFWLDGIFSAASEAFYRLSFRSLRLPMARPTSRSDGLPPSAIWPVQRRFFQVPG